MERIRIRWAAFVAALLLIVSMAGVAGATYLAQPSAVGAPHVQAAPVAEDADQDTDEDTDEDSDTNEDTDQVTGTDADSDGSQGEHGAAVSAVAQSDAVGGPNDNHGGAVSAVARGDHGPSAEVVTAAPTSHGDSAAHRQDAAHRP